MNDDDDGQLHILKRNRGFDIYPDIYSVGLVLSLAT